MDVKVGQPTEQSPAKGKLSEVMGLLMDLYLSLFQTTTCDAMGMGPDLYFNSVMFGTPVRICRHPRIGEYFEMCTKKLIVLLCSDAIEGFELNLLNGSDIVQRFVFRVSGKLNCEDLDEVGYKSLLQEMHVNSRRAIEIMRGKFGEIRRKRKRGITRVLFSLGLVNEESYGPYLEEVFRGEGAFETFPWSKPRKTPSEVVLRTSVPPIAGLESLSLLEKSSSESSPFKNSKSGMQQNAQQNPPVSIPICTSQFGDLKICTTAVLYMSDPDPIDWSNDFVDLVQKSEVASFGSSLINSPGLYTSTWRESFFKNLQKNTKVQTASQTSPGRDTLGSNNRIRDQSTSPLSTQASVQRQSFARSLSSAFETSSNCRISPYDRPIMISPTVYPKRGAKLRCRF